MKKILVGILFLLILWMIILKVLSNSYNDLISTDVTIEMDEVENNSPYDVIESRDEEGNTIKKYIYIIE